MKYTVIRANTQDDLSFRVEQMLTQGWEPQGGVSVCEYVDRWTNERKGYDESETYTVFAQALIHRSNPT